MRWLRNLLSPAKLQHFYQDYLDWVESGVPDHPYFCRHEGLCSQLMSWSLNKKVGVRRYAEMLAEMTAQFRQLGNGDIFPFGREAYRLAKVKGAMHLDTNRMRFVRQHAQ
jgi:hypothetical protein